MLAELWAHRLRDPKEALMKVIALVGLFVIVTIPSWLPRLWYIGNPIYHGYLPNYLWVDTYKEAHVGGPPRYSLRYYIDRHDLGDVLDRLSHGHFRVYIATFKKDLVLVAMSLWGLTAGIWRRSKMLLLIGLWAYIQSLPLVWTNLSNPTLRLPYFGLFPFLVIFASYGVAEIEKALTRWYRHFATSKQS
jgi:hypothetical protein